ncbi:hypothetical protein CYMTET_31050, partial [Cymbomonas tetramitiformis]
RAGTIFPLLGDIRLPCKYGWEWSGRCCEQFSEARRLLQSQGGGAAAEWGAYGCACNTHPAPSGAAGFVSCEGGKHPGTHLDHFGEIFFHL